MKLNKNVFAKLAAFSALVLAVVLVSFPAQVRAAADITIANAKITSANTVLVTFNNPGQNLASVDFTKWHIDQNGGGVSPLTPTSAVVTSAPTPWTVTLTFAGTPFSSTSTSYSAALGLYADASAVTDTNADTNTVVADSASIAITDAQTPTFTAVRTALNTIVLTYSESVTETAILNSYTVAGASAVTNTAVTSGTSVTLTTTGLTSTSSTPAVAYVSATGDVADAAANETANGATANAADQVPPTFTAARTALNTIVLTFSENVTGTAIANSFTVAGASAVTNTAVTAGTSVTLTTTGLTSTSSTPAVTYVAATGDIHDVSAALNETANGATANAADQVPPTFTADRTALNTIVLTFSESVTGTAIADSFTVVGASAVTNTAVTAGTSVTLTTTGLTSTSSTPAVGYVAATGDIHDVSTALNEVANGGAVSATDHVAPTLVISLSDNDISANETMVVTFTFSEAPTGFAADDVIIGHGTLGTIDATNPLVQTATFTPNDVSTTEVISVGTGWTDSSAALNAPAGVTDSPSYTIRSNHGGSSHGGGGSSSHPATPATPAVPGVNPATPASPNPQGNAYAFGQTTVKMGSKGEACKAWQMFFNAHGAKLAIDGSCGKLSIAAAKAWQMSVGLKADGALGPMSRAKAMMQ